MGEAKRRSEQKLEVAKRMIASLRSMVPSHPTEFICPICERAYSLSNPSKITYGHIVPKAAGRDETVLICEPCNSSSGHSIDKWFGELVRVSEDGKSIFNARHRDNRIKINGVSVGGRMERREDGSFEVLVFKNRSNPRALEELHKNVQSGLKTIEIAFPLLRNRALANMGALQAGYLALIKAFGYVPMLQRSLDIVRTQLRDTSRNLLGKQFIAIPSADIGFSTGIAQLPGGHCLYSAFRRVIVFYPTCNAGDDFYSSLPNDYKVAGVQLHPFRSRSLPPPEAAMGLLLGSEILVWPDKAETLPPDFLVAYLERPGDFVQFLRGMSAEEANQLQSRTDVEIIRKHVPAPPIGR